MAPLFAQPSGSEEEMRTWTSRAGSEFTGRVKRTDGDRVFLAGRTGREISLHRDQLSPADRTYLRDLDRIRHAAALDFYRSGPFDPDALPGQTEIEGVRHVVQRENFCVPASAEMLLGFYGYDYDQDYIARITSRDSSRSAGTSFRDLSHALQNLGLDSVSISQHPGNSRTNPRQNQLNGVRTAIADGYPVLISYETASVGHAVLAIGYDDRRRSFSVLDPAQGRRPERLDYREVEELITGALVVIPRPFDSNAATQMNGSPQGKEFLRSVSRLLPSTRPSDLEDLVQRLNEQNVSSRLRDVNRLDLRSSQGQTRSYARREGLEFVRLGLDRGFVLVAPQTFDAGQGLILIYATSGQDFWAIEHYPDGTVHRGKIRPLDFARRWLSRSDRQYFLPLVEIELPLHDTSG